MLDCIARPNNAHDYRHENSHEYKHEYRPMFICVYVQELAYVPVCVRNYASVCVHVCLYVWTFTVIPCT